MNEIKGELKLYSIALLSLLVLEAIQYFFYPNSPFEGFIIGMGFSFALVVLYKLFFEKKENINEQKSSKGKSKK